MEAHYLTAACATVNIFVFSLLLVAMDFQGRSLIFIPSTLLPFINSGKTRGVTELLYVMTGCACHLGKGDPGETGGAIRDFA